MPGNCVYLSKTPPASPPWVHQVRFPPAGSEVPGLCTPVHNSVFLETVMTPSEQGCLNRRHGNTACWERSSSTRASHGVGPGAWSSLAPGGHRLPTGVGPGLGPASLLGGHRLPTGVGPGLVQPRSWGSASLGMQWICPPGPLCPLSPKVLPALQNTRGAFLRMLWFLKPGQFGSQGPSARGAPRTHGQCAAAGTKFLGLVSPVTVSSVRVLGHCSERCQPL